MISLLFTLLAILPARADFAWVTYETTSFPNEACIPIREQDLLKTDHAQAFLSLFGQARQLNLNLDHNYFTGDGGCHTQGPERVFRMADLFEGSPEDIQRFAANPPTFSGQFLSFTFKVTPIKSLIGHYVLREKYDRAQLANALIRPVAGLTLERQQFVSAVCRWPMDDLLQALSGTPNETAAVDFLNRYPTSYQLQVELEMHPFNGAPFLVRSSSIWGCTGF